MAHRVGALREKDLEWVTVDTTVQEKAIAFPTDAKLMQRARERLVRLAREHGIALRQSYTRLGKRALIMQGRYRHAKQHKRANKALRKLKTHLAWCTFRLSMFRNTFCFASLISRRRKMMPNRRSINSRTARDVHNANGSLS